MSGQESGQNAELSTGPWAGLSVPAAAALETAEARLRLVMQAANIGFWEWDMKTNTAYHSPEWKRQLGYQDHEISNAFDEFQSRIHPEDKERVQKVIQAFLDAPQPGYDLEFRLRHRDGSYRWIHSQGVLIRDGAGRPVRLLGVHVDVTAAKLRELELRASQERFRRLAETTAIIPWEADASSGRFLYVGPRSTSILGYAPQAWLEADFWGKHLHPDDRDSALQLRRKQARQAQDCEAEYRMIAADGRTVWLHDFFHVVHRAGKPEKLQGFLVDVTQRKQLEAEVLQISEREQQRIARDLHDGLGQLLSGTVHLSTALQAELAEQTLPEAGEALRITELLHQAVAEARSLARGLYPVRPEADGLEVALDELASRTQQLFDVSCTFRCQAPAGIHDNAMATHLYRIAQEAVTNALRHGKARRLQIGLIAKHPRIRLTVADDGIGFPDGDPTGKGMGIRIMRYRAGMIGGTLTILKRARVGSRIVCTAPHPPLKVQ